MHLFVIYILLPLISQFFVHPVLFDLMSDKWLGAFGKMKRSSWITAHRWMWILLNIWCLFDLVMFPFLFAGFYLKHLINKNKLKDKGMKRDLYSGRIILVIVELPKIGRVVDYCRNKHFSFFAQQLTSNLENVKLQLRAPLHGEKIVIGRSVSLHPNHLYRAFIWKKNDSQACMLVLTLSLLKYLEVSNFSKLGQPTWAWGCNKNKTKIGLFKCRWIQHRCVNCGHCKLRKKYCKLNINLKRIGLRLQTKNEENELENTGDISC